MGKEEILEKLRRTLAKSPNFNLINLFKLIDHQNKGFVTVRLIEKFMEKPSMTYECLVKNFEREKGKLRFQDFCMLFRPLSKKLNDLLDERPEHRVPVLICLCRTHSNGKQSTC
jgi:Ca2+-binding EF-hand superfamily protein